MADQAYLEGKELHELREIATELGIEFPGNVGKKKLISRITEDDKEVNGSPTKVEIEGVKVKKKETPTEIRKRMNILRRVRISANDPQYKGRNGVTRQVGNRHGVVGKYIPFDVSWHCQEPVYQDLKAQKYRQTKFKVDTTTGMKVPVTTWHPSFVIEELPALTDADLKKLAADQSARGSIPNETD